MRVLMAVSLLAALCAPGLAQDLGTLNPRPLPPLAHWTWPAAANCFSPASMSMEL